MRRLFQKRDCRLHLSGAQRIDSQEQIYEIVLGRQFIRAVQQRECLTELALLVKIEGLLDQILRLLFRSRTTAVPQQRDDR